MPVALKSNLMPMFCNIKHHQFFVLGFFNMFYKIRKVAWFALTLKKKISSSFQMLEYRTQEELLKFGFTLADCEGSMQWFFGI